MTIDDLNKLTDAELNRLVAERVMGWRLNVSEWWISKYAGASLREAIHSGDWIPSTDYNDAALVRAAIERRSLQQRFCRILAASTPDPLIAKNYWWHLCNATPRETCIAALLAMDGVK